MSPIRLSSSIMLPTPQGGSTSARAQDFRGWSWPFFCADRPGAEVHLVESNGRKCAFLRHAARVTGAAAVVHEARLETVVGPFAGRIDVVTARALAPLANLIAWTRPLLPSGSIGLFPKGREAQAELTEAAKSWRFTAQITPSRTSSDGRILRIEGLREPP